MAGPMPLFRTIHRLRTHLHNLQEQLDRIPRVRKAHQARLAKADEALRDAQETVRKLKVTASDREKTLKSKHAQIARYEEQVNLVSSKKEYDALQLEIAHARTVCGQLEDQILQALTDSDEKSAQVPELEKVLAQVKGEVEKFEADAKTRKADLEAQAGQAREELRAAEASIPDDLRAQYNRTVASLGHEGLAAVKGRNCTECYTEIIRSDLDDLADDRFVTCKSCGRILYLPETARGSGEED